MAFDAAAAKARLGLTGDPTTGEVRIARRRVAKRLHPDRAGPGAQRAMAELNRTCDELIASIRTSGGALRAPTSGPPPPAETAPAAPADEPSDPVATVRARPPDLLDIARTLIVLVVATAAVLLVAGSTSGGAIAIALLTGAVVAGAFVAVTWWLADP